MALVLTDSHGKYFQQHFDNSNSGIVSEFESGMKIEEVFPKFHHLIYGFKVCSLVSTYNILGYGYCDIKQDCYDLNVLRFRHYNRFLAWLSCDFIFQTKRFHP